MTRPWREWYDRLRSLRGWRRGRIDLDQPVENPCLLKAIERLAQQDSSASRDALLRELNRANFLVAVLADEMMTDPPDRAGQTVIQSGSRLKFFTVGSGDELRLPLFTDWRAIADFTDQDVTGMVMPARQAWNFVLADESYRGAVINPYSPASAVPLDRDLLRFLLGG